MNQKPLQPGQKPPSNSLYPPPNSNPPLNIPPLILSAQVNPHQRLISPPNTNQFFIKPLHQQQSNRPIPAFEDPSSSFKTLPNFESPKQRRPQKITGNMLFTAEAKKTHNLTDSFSKDHHQKFFNTDPKITIPQCEQNHIQPLLQNNTMMMMKTENHPPPPGSSHKKPQQNELNLFEKPEVINIEESQINNAQQQIPINPTMIPETNNNSNNSNNPNNPNNNTILSSNQMRTKVSLENYYQTLNEVPNKVQERLQGHKPPEVWDLGLTDTLSFFKQLPHTNMEPEEFMHEEHHLEPQGMDLPTELLEDFTKCVENRTVKLHQDLKGVHDLFMYGQKVEKLFGDKTNQSIHRTKEISSAFSGLSNYIWDCLQNQFQFPDGTSQESTMSFQDVAEKVTSQKFFAEINDDPPTDDLLTFFHHLISQNSDPELNAELQNHLPELLAHGLLDQDLAKYLFGDSFDLQTLNIEPNKNTVVQPNPAETELHNQFLTISQDLQQIPKHQHNMEEEPKPLINLTTLTFAQQLDTKKNRHESPPSHHMSEEKIKEGAQQAQERVPRRLIRGVKTSASVTQMSVTQPSMTNQSETTGFPDHFMEFEEPFMPLGLGLEEEGDGGFVGGFPFMSGESFPLGGFGDNEDEDIGSNNI